MLPASIKKNMTLTMISSPTVKECGLDQTKQVFYTRIEADISIGGARSKIGARFEFPIDELKNGASLARMMTLDMRKFLNSRQCTDLTEQDRKQFRDAGSNAVKQLRAIIEPYFAYLVIHRHERDDE